MSFAGITSTKPETASGLGGVDPGSVSVQYKVVVGNATPDTTGSRTAFGAALRLT